MGRGTYKNFELLPRSWDLKNSELSSYILWALGLGKNPSYLIYGHETCFYCRDLDGNYVLMYSPPFIISTALRHFT